MVAFGALRRLPSLILHLECSIGPRESKCKTRAAAKSQIHQFDESSQSDVSVQLFVVAVPLQKMADVQRLRETGTVTVAVT